MSFWNDNTDSNTFRLFAYIFGSILAWYIIFHRILTRFCTGRKAKFNNVKAPKYGRESTLWPYRCAHRGGAAEMPENTIEAFQNSINQNIRYLELDVHLTLDNQVIITHDYDLTRTCETDDQQRKLIGEYNYDELPPLRDSFTTGVWADQRYTKKEENGAKYKLCKLEDLFQLCAQKDNFDVICKINLKNGQSLNHLYHLSYDQKMEAFKLEVKLTYDLIVKYKMQNRIFWVSQYPSCQAILEEYEDIARCFDNFHSRIIIIMFVLGLIWLYPLKAQNYNMPVISTQAYKFIKGNSLTEESGRGGCLIKFLFWVVFVNLLNQKRLYEHLRRRGVIVVLWAANSDAQFEQVYEAYGKSIDGLMSDCPEKLAGFIQQKEGIQQEKAQGDAKAQEVQLAENGSDTDRPIVGGQANIDIVDATVTVQGKVGEDVVDIEADK